MNNSGFGNIKRLLFTISFVFLFILYGSAQVFIETYPPVSNNTDMGVRITGIANLSDRLPYERISGSPFYSDEWQLASLYGSNAKEKWLCKVKLNLATGELYYLDKEGKELVTDDELVKKVTIHKMDDTSSVIAVFILSPMPVRLNKEVRNSYLQLLNEGPYELLKLNKKSLMSADSLFGTLKRYFFKDETVFFVNHNEMLTALKKLDKENLLQFLPGSSAYGDWAKENKINFKKEQDVLLFMNYYNSKNK